MPKTEQGSASQRGAGFALQPVSLRDLFPIGVLLAVAIVTFPFAFECCAVLIVVFPRLRDALARAQHVWAAAVIAVLAMLVLSDEALRFVLHHNVFALFSSEDFLASRQAQIIERVALLLSFSCLLLLGRLAVIYRSETPKLELGGVLRAAVIAGGLGLLVVNWNHFVAQVSFLPQGTVSWAGFSLTDPHPTAPLVALILGAFTLVGGLALIFLVLTIKAALTQNSGGKNE